MRRDRQMVVVGCSQAYPVWMACAAAGRIVGIVSAVTFVVGVAGATCFAFASAVASFVVVATLDYTSVASSFAGTVVLTSTTGHVVVGTGQPVLGGVVCEPVV